MITFTYKIKLIRFPINSVLLFLTILTLFLKYNSAIYADTHLNIDNWQVHTSMLNVQSVATDSQGRLWIGTTGGLTIYDNDKKDTILINHLNGLLSSNITTICPNIENKLLILGTNDGIIEIVTEELEFIHITSIRDHNFSNPIINDIIVYNDKAYIAGGWGLAEFNIPQRIFTNTIETIGLFQKNTPINNIFLQNDTLWAATAVGIAYTTPNTKKINLSKSWTSYKYPNDTTYINAQMTKLNNIIYINFGTHIYALNYLNNEYSIILQSDGLSYNNIKKIDIFNNQLIYNTTYQLFILNQGEIFSNWSTEANNFNILKSNNSKYIISFNYNKLGTTLINQDLKSYITLTPNTPCTNYFMDLAINSKGKIYAVTDNSINNKTSGGIMSYDGHTWINYNNLHSDAPFSINEQFNSISVSKDDKIFAGGWGLGLVIIDENTNDISKKYTIINEHNSPMTPYSDNYRIAGETAFDSNGKPWTVIYGARTSGSLLMTYNTDYSNYRTYTNIFSPQNRMYYNIVIDNYDTKWLIGALNTVGIIYLNEKQENNIYDDIFGNINTSTHPNLLNNDANCIAVDKIHSRIWIGTSNGISIILNSYSVINNGNIIVSSFSFLKGETINDIFIDAIGNKWIATNSGVFILNTSDDTLGSITTSNSPLKTNEIYSLLMNQETGTLYLGTKTGLYTAQTSIIRPDNKYTLIAYPSPFNIEKHSFITIDGLVSGSEIRILTTDGKRIKTLYTDSKRTLWDGKDENNNKVPPGVYIIISSSIVTNTSAACKIAIIE